MSTQPYAPSQTFAHLAGWCYLLIIVTGIFGQMFVRNSMIEPGDAATTVQNLLAEPGFWRAGIIGDLIMHIADIPVVVFFYLLFRTVNKPLALIALVSNIFQTAVAVANKLNLIMPLLILENGTGVITLSETEIRLVANFLTAHDYGFGIALIFFGISCVLYGLLIIKSRYIPKVIGGGLCAAGACYIINSATLLAAPHLAGSVFYVLIVCLIAELTLALWLISKGIRTNTRAMNL